MVNQFPEIIINNLSQLNKSLNDIDYSSAFIIVDENTKKYCLPKLTHLLPEFHKFKLIELPGGEINKGLKNCERIWLALLKLSADRNSLLINLGGGVVSDTGGFAASVFKRGIRFINIPTSLMAMIDAAIGGKTGVNLRNLKNQIGLFVQPELIFISPAFLDTLPSVEILSGFGEIIKYALISGGDFWKQLCLGKITPLDDLTDVIKRCVSIKEKVVRDDFFEKQNRKILNFGHSAGHALETNFLSAGKSLLHGHAVALGILAESAISVKYAGLNLQLFEKIKKVVSGYFGTKLLIESLKSDITQTIMADKKNSKGKINIVLMENPGNFKLDFYIKASELDDFWKNEMPDWL